MKRRLAMILGVMLMVGSLAGCSSAEADTDKKISKDEFIEKYVEVIDITKDNFDDYFDIKKVRSEYKDASNKPTGTYSVDYCVEFNKDPYSVAFADNVKLDFSYKTKDLGCEYYNYDTDKLLGEDKKDAEYKDCDDEIQFAMTDGAQIAYKEYAEEPEKKDMIKADGKNINVDAMVLTVNKQSVKDIKLTKAQGKIAVIKQLPDDVWNENKNDSANPYFVIDTKDGTLWYYYEDGKVEYKDENKTDKSEYDTARNGSSYDWYFPFIREVFE